MRKKTGSRPITEDEKVRMTLERFRGLNGTGSMRPIKQLAEEFQRDPAVISKAISDAFREGLIEVHAADKRSREPRRLERLETALLGRFSQLDAAIVVASEASPDLGRGSADTMRHSDEVHAKLGSAMAHAIGSGPLIRGDDLIGVAGGRGVYHTVAALQNLPPLRGRQVTLGSLNGATHARHLSWKRNLALDADFNVGLLGSCFGSEVKMQFVSHPIVLQNATEAAAIISRTWFGSRSIAKITLDTVLVGIGVFVSGHRFYEDGAVMSDSEPMLAPIGMLLNKLRQLCEPFTTPVYSPVADVVYRLFYVYPPRGVAIPQNKVKDMLCLIAEINERLVTVPTERLQETKLLMLVAGTRRKALAIRALLTEYTYPVRILCTDEEAAMIILSENL